jgi:hypothetical protein
MKKQTSDQRGIAHHLLLVVIAVLVVGAIGFAGYRVIKGRDIDAKAAGYTYLGAVNPESKGKVSFYGCKVVAGTDVQLRFFAKNKSSDYVYLKADVTRVDASGRSGTVVDTDAAYTNAAPKRLERNLSASKAMVTVKATTSPSDRYSVVIGKNPSSGAYLPQGVLNWSTTFGGQLLSTLGAC